MKLFLLLSTSARRWSCVIDIVVSLILVAFSAIHIISLINDVLLSDVTASGTSVIVVVTAIVCMVSGDRYCSGF